MRRSALWTVLSCVWLVACGGDGPATAFIPRDDGGDEDANTPDSGVDSSVAGEDGGSGTGGSGGGDLTGDLCTSYLRGLSCRVQQVTAGRYFTCALVEGGRVKCWGRWNGTVGDGPDEMGDDLPFVDFGVPIVEIAGGESELAARAEDGRVFSVLFPADTGGLLLDTVALAPEQQVVSLGGPRCALLVDGGVTCWAWRARSGYTTPLLAAPVAPVLMDEPTITGAAHGGFTTCLTTAQGDVLCLRGGSPALGQSALDIGERVKAIAPGREHNCVIVEDGSRLKCWGKNLFGQLGQNNTLPIGLTFGEPLAADAVAIGAVTQAALGGDFTCALTADGGTYCWGVNTAGQLGAGTITPFGAMVGDFPTKAMTVDLGTGRRATQLAVGEAHVCALLDDHSLKCWGLGELGALGLGDPSNRGDAVNEMGDYLPRVDLGELTLEELRLRGPALSVLSPSEAFDPQVDPVHSGPSLTVTCGATPSEETGFPVDDATVRVVVHEGAAIGPVVSQATAVRATVGRYTATLLGFDVLPSGSYWIECIAADNQTEPYTGSAAIRILHDGGPNLVITAPDADQVVGQSAVLHVDLSVTAAPLGSNDPGAEVVSRELTVAGVVVPLVPHPTEQNRYTADVNLLAPAFVPAPVGNILLGLRSVNVRGVTAALQRSIVVDGTGPVIAVQGNNHDNGDLVRGAQGMLLTLTDTQAGVDPSAAYGRISDEIFPFERLTGDAYRGVFDTLQFDRTFSQLTVEIHVFDLVGNESVETRSLQLDNQPPLVSLDPPMVREYTNAGLCSVPFDPVGSDSLSDGDIAPEGAELRARIEDLTNGLEGDGVLTYLALVDPARVRVYIQDDLAAPILIDTNNDEICDEVNDEVPPTLRALMPIAPAGKSYYPASAATDGLQPTWGSGCDAGTDLTAPAPLCAPTSPLTRVIRASVLGVPVPAIYGLPVVNSVSCVGDAWDWRLQFPDGGPVCVVARAEDTLGNVGVSPPLRLCLQRSDGLGFDCAADTSWRAHDCLAGDYGGDAVTCDPPPDYGLGYVREENPQ